MQENLKLFMNGGLCYLNTYDKFKDFHKIKVAHYFGVYLYLRP